MYLSGEVRWFSKGGADDALEQWITSGGLAESQEQRVDRYLVLPGCTTVGIKIREGNFEVKARTSPSEFVAYTDTVAGFCNSWVKWSRPLDDLPGVAAPGGDDERWVFVRKQRAVRLFSLESGEPEEVAYGGHWLAAGCQVEKTDIEVLPSTDGNKQPEDVDWSLAERWWSFSFEAFGESAQLLRNLDVTVRYVAHSEPAIALGRNDSMSYPEWLSAL